MAADGVYGVVRSFDEFVVVVGPRLRAGLVAAYGSEVGVEAAADCLVYAWQHWERVAAMDNPAGYLYRVGQSAARRSRRQQGWLPAPDPTDVAEVEPGLLPALRSLSELQRICVVMVHGYGWSQADVAAMLEITASTVRTHLARGLAHLQRELEVAPHAD